MKPSKEKQEEYYETKIEKEIQRLKNKYKQDEIARDLIRLGAKPMEVKENGKR